MKTIDSPTPSSNLQRFFTLNAIITHHNNEAAKLYDCHKNETKCEWFTFLLIKKHLFNVAYFIEMVMIFLADIIITTVTIRIISSCIECTQFNFYFHKLPIDFYLSMARNIVDRKMTFYSSAMQIPHNETNHFC